jgi:hypothetical protein
MMHPDTMTTMRWILRAGGQVTPSLLGYWRFVYGGGDREARRRLSTFEKRGWMKRQGTERYPLFTLTHEGHAMALAAGIEVQCAVSRNPKPTAKHDAGTAAILQRAVDLGVLVEWWSQGEFVLTKDALDFHRKEPDAIGRIRMKGGAVALIAIETETSKKGGTLKRGRSNWARTAEEVRTRLEKPLEVVIDGEKQEIQYTLFIGLDQLLALGMTTKLEEAGVREDLRFWLVGDRLAMKVTTKPGAVDLELKLPPKIDPELAGL